MAKEDAVAASAILLFAAVSVREASRLPLGTPGSPGPGFLPWWVGITLGLLTLFRLGQIWKAPPIRGPGDHRRIGAVAGLVVALAVYVLLLESVGYPLCTFLLVSFILRVVAPHRWTVALGVAALAAVGTFVVFAVWLNVPLPPGPSLR
jgi:putative tricarboxylic transport membrane protein